jgi:hypothetical protein
MTNLEETTNPYLPASSGMDWSLTVHPYPCLPAYQDYLGGVSWHRQGEGKTAIAVDAARHRYFTLDALGALEASRNNAVSKKRKRDPEGVPDDIPCSKQTKYGCPFDIKVNETMTMTMSMTMTPVSSPMNNINKLCIVHGTSDICSIYECDGISIDYIPQQIEYMNYIA